MLFLATRLLEHDLNSEGRLRLLEKLDEEKFSPLIRQTRLGCFEQILADPKQAGEMERIFAASTRSEDESPYVQGDLFCFEDHIFFLLFGDSYRARGAMRVGIIYEPQMAEPLKKLDSFCKAVSRCLPDSEGQQDQCGEDGETSMTARQQDSSSVHEVFRRFIAKQDVDGLSTIARNGREGIWASELLDDDYTRLFLRRAREAYAEGMPVNSSGNDGGAPSRFIVGRLEEAGLLQREVLVSCRRTGHILFSLPTSDSLATVTVSMAKCSECGAQVVDEKVEEVVAPTPFASVLLEDGTWLVKRLQSILRALGIPESEVSVAPPAGDGEARMVARVCGEPFLIVMRDGDLTPAFARRAMKTRLETEARHLVVVVTGTIHNEGRAVLVGSAERLVRGGNDFELIIAGGASAAESELRCAFERVSRRVLAEQMCELDKSLGLSVVRLITTRFQLLHDSRKTGGANCLPVHTSSAQSLQTNFLQPFKG